jgi:hypothetical protein
LWKFYSWMVRVEPETGYVGLHRVSVFAVCLLVFMIVGAAAGLVVSRLHRSAEGRGSSSASRVALRATLAVLGSRGIGVPPMRLGGLHERDARATHHFSN